MIKVEVIETFTLERFNELEDIEWVSVATPGRLNVGDKFECTQDMCDYLTGRNDKGKCVVKVIEVIPPKKPLELPKKKIGKKAHLTK